MEKVTFKSIRRVYNAWLTAKAETLSDVYSSWSGAKQEAFNYCRDLYRCHDGWRFRILGANTSTFSVAFLGYVNGEQALFYITKSHDRYAIIE